MENEIENLRACLDVEESELLEDDSRYRKLSYQLFGKARKSRGIPTAQYNGPFVRLTAAGQNSNNRKETADCLVLENGWITEENARLIKKREQPTGRCIICYSVICQDELGESPSFRKMKKKLFSEFLRFLVSSKINSQENFIKETEFDDLDVSLDHVVTLLSTMSINCLCEICFSTSKQLLSKRRLLDRLQNQINEITQKITAAIQLSTAIAENQSNKLSRDVSHRENGNILEEDVGTSIVSLTETIDIFRKRFLGGKKLKIKLNDPMPAEEVVKTELISDPVVDETDMLSLDDYIKRLENDDASSPHPPVDLNAEESNLSDCASADLQSENRSCDKSSSETDNLAFQIDSLPVDSSDDGNSNVPEDTFKIPRSKRKTVTRSRVISTPQVTEKNKTRKKKELSGKPRRGQNWFQRDGKYYYRDMEIERTAEGKFVCPYDCPVSARYLCREHLVRHMTITHAEEFGGEQPKLSCDECDQKFYRPHELARHKRGKHGEGYQCDTCGYLTSDPSSLTHHIRAVHLKLKPNRCETCGKGFHSKRALRRHWVVHTRERAYVCDTCGKAFANESGLSAHIKATHLGIRPHVCETCDKTFRTAWELGNHNKRHIQNDALRSASEAERKMHRQMNKKPKIHICEYCKKAFAQKAYLKVHTRIHTGQKPFECHICGESFRQKSNLDQHVRYNHKQEDTEQDQQQMLKEEDNTFSDVYIPIEDS